MRQSPDSWWQPPLAPSLLSSFLRRPARDSSLHLSFPKASRRELDSAGNSLVLERVAHPARPEPAPVWKGEPDTLVTAQFSRPSDLKASRRELDSAGNSLVLERVAHPARPEPAPVWKGEPDTLVTAQLSRP